MSGAGLEEEPAPCTHGPPDGSSPVARAIAALGAATALLIAGCGSGGDSSGTSTSGGAGCEDDRDRRGDPDRRRRPDLPRRRPGLLRRGGARVTLELGPGRGGHRPRRGQRPVPVRLQQLHVTAARHRQGPAAEGCQRRVAPPAGRRGLRRASSCPPTAPSSRATDLAGKTVAVNTLNNINTTTINAVVREAGGDPTAITVHRARLPRHRRRGRRATSTPARSSSRSSTIATVKGMRQIGSTTRVPTRT